MIVKILLYQAKLNSNKILFFRPKNKKKQDIILDYRIVYLYQVDIYREDSK